PPFYFTALTDRFRIRADQLVVETLMVAFTVVVHNEFGRCATNRAFAKEDQPVQARLLDRAHESLCIGVQIRTSRWESYRLHAHIGKHAQELYREQRISIVDQVAFALEDSVHRISKVAPDLVHPEPIRNRCNASDLHLPRR